MSEYVEGVRIPLARRIGWQGYSKAAQPDFAQCTSSGSSELVTRALFRSPFLANPIHRLRLKFYVFGPSPAKQRPSPADGSERRRLANLQHKLFVQALRCYTSLHRTLRRRTESLPTAVVAGDLRAPVVLERPHVPWNEWHSPSPQFFAAGAMQGSRPGTSTTTPGKQRGPWRLHLPKTRPVFLRCLEKV